MKNLTQQELTEKTEKEIPFRFLRLLLFSFSWIGIHPASTNK